LFGQLERKLKIGDSQLQHQADAGSGQSSAITAEDLRPDLVFLLGNEGLGRIVIVELKAPNTPLLDKHLLQLRDYMRDARSFLREKVEGHVSVEGRLIGTLDLSGSSKEIRRLKEKIQEQGPTAKWAVDDINRLLTRARKAHSDFLKQHGGDGVPNLDGN